MTKQQFCARLKAKLKGLPKKDVEERLSFYGEMIDDRIESGLSEEEAISDVGTADEVASQIIGEITSSGSNEEKATKTLSAWQTVLLVLGSPLWIAIVLAGIAVIISIYAVIWSVTLAIWAVELPLFILSFISKYLLIGCKYTTRSAVYITKRCVFIIKDFLKSGE